MRGENPLKSAYLIPLFALVMVVNVHAQGRIFRCGNTYTNDAAEAKTKNCKLVEGGYITVVEGTRVQGNGAANAPVKVAAAAPSSAGTRVDSAEQKTRDSDARQILESELKKAETRQSELLKEYNNGEPDKQGAEGRNYQKYLDRVAELKASIARNESDIAGLKRELGRVPASK
jgi:hypothetical protein